MIFKYIYLSIFALRERNQPWFELSSEVFDAMYAIPPRVSPFVA